MSIKIRAAKPSVLKYQHISDRKVKEKGRVNLLYIFKLEIRRREI